MFSSALFKERPMALRPGRSEKPLSICVKPA
jgi:hypothetical protein